MRETGRAARAFADYVALGERRRLEDLAVHYRATDGAPTHSLDTLKRWSEQHHWQDRVEEFVRENNRQVLKRLQSDIAGRKAAAARVLLKGIASVEAQWDHGVPADPKKLVALQKQLFQVLGEPLAEKVEQKTDLTVHGILTPEQFSGLSPDEQEGYLAALRVAAETDQAERPPT